MSSLLLDLSPADFDLEQLFAEGELSCKFWMDLDYCGKPYEWEVILKCQTHGLRKLSILCPRHYEETCNGFCFCANCAQSFNTYESLIVVYASKRS